MTFLRWLAPLLLVCGASAWAAPVAAKPLSTKVTERVVDSAIDSGLEALARPENQRRLGLVLSSTALTGGVHDIAAALVDGVFDGLSPRMQLGIDGPAFWKGFDHAVRRHVGPAATAVTRSAVDTAMATALSEDQGVRIEAFMAHATHGIIKGLAIGIREDLAPALAFSIRHDLAPAGAVALEEHIMPAFARGLSQPGMQAALAGTMSSIARNLVRGGDAGMTTAKAENDAQGRVGAMEVFGDRLSIGFYVVAAVAAGLVGLLITLAVLLVRSNRSQRRLVAQGRRSEAEMLAALAHRDRDGASEADASHRPEPR